MVKSVVELTAGFSDLFFGDPVDSLNPAVSIFDRMHRTSVVREKQRARRRKIRRRARAGMRG